MIRLVLAGLFERHRLPVRLDPQGLDIIDKLGLEEDARGKILYGNAERLMAGARADG